MAMRHAGRPVWPAAPPAHDLAQRANMPVARQSLRTTKLKFNTKARPPVRLLEGAAARPKPDSCDVPLENAQDPGSQVAEPTLAPSPFPDPVTRSMGWVRAGCENQPPWGLAAPCCSLEPSWVNMQQTSIHRIAKRRSMERGGSEHKRPDEERRERRQKQETG